METAKNVVECYYLHYYSTFNTCTVYMEIFAPVLF